MDTDRLVDRFGYPLGLLIVGTHMGSWLIVGTTIYVLVGKL